MAENNLRRRNIGLLDDEEDDVSRPLLSSQSDAQTGAASPRPSPLAARPQSNNGTVTNPAGMNLTWADFIFDLWKRLFGTTWPFGSDTSSRAKTPASFVLDEAVRGRMAGFKIYATKPFSDQEVSHLAALRSLWSASFPDDYFHAEIKSQKWKELGFQGDDPRTDFRGAGILGLRNILYLTEHYPAAFTAMADIKNTKIVEAYPFAITCLNVTMQLRELLGMGWKGGGSSATLKGTFPTLAGFLFAPDLNEEESCETISSFVYIDIDLPLSLTMTDSVAAFSECFCLIMSLLDQTWTRMGAKYMDFPAVLTRTREETEETLATFRSYEDLVTYNRTHIGAMM